MQQFIQNMNIKLKVSCKYFSVVTLCLKSFWKCLYAVKLTWLHVVHCIIHIVVAFFGTTFWQWSQTIAKLLYLVKHHGNHDEDEWKMYIVTM